MPGPIHTLYESKRFSVVERECTRPDGTSATCEYVRHPGSVAILPLVDESRVCLIHSRRVTVDRTLIEIPAGTRETGEAPLDTARRELAEETGYRAARFDELAVVYPSPGVMDEQMWLYVARELTAGNPAREANEEIENLIVTLDDALAMVERGDISDSKTLVALLLYTRSGR
jgi:ADP-ribose pyrophosphatase